MSRKTIVSLILFLIVFQPLYSQFLEDRHFNAMNFRNIGPAGMSGRITCIEARPDNPSQIYCGTASGGVWYSKNGGASWTPIFDDQPLQSIGSIAIHPQNPDLIWVGTGEGNPRNSYSSGAGVFKSVDGGKNWQFMGLEGSKSIHRIILDPHNPKVVYLGVIGAAWGPHPERGVYKSTNGGESWEKILFVNDSTGVADLVMDPQNPNKLIAAMWEFSRKPWTFKSGGKGSGLYVTFDGGKSWKKRTEKEGLPKGELGRIGLAISPSSPKVVYALIESKKTGLYRSDDGGFNWKLQSTKNIGNRPFYYADIYVDPKNENRLYNLYSLVSVSEDAGKTFRVILPYTGQGVHPDHHAFWIDPNNPDLLMNGNDGGLNISRDRGESWQFSETLPLGQFYHIQLDNQTPYMVYGGMQDNGSGFIPSAVWKSGGIRNSDWQEVLFGDGFDVLPQPGNPNIIYSMYQGGHLHRFSRENNTSTLIQPVHPEGIDLRFNWNAALAADPFQYKGLYFGSQFVHYSADEGRSWRIISPDLTSNDPEKQKQAKSGGLTIDATRAENFTSILCIAPNPHNQQEIWVGTDDGKLQFTKDGGQNWSELSGKLPQFPAGAWIPQIRHSKTNKEELFVVVNDYRRNNWKPYLYHSQDNGKSWKLLAGEGQVKGHCLSVIQDTEVEDLIFLGTEFGLYFSLDHGKNWQKWHKSLPSMPVRDMQIQEREKDLVLGTFGRAIWILDDIGSLRELAKEGTGILSEDFHLFEGGHAYKANYKPAEGVRFGANGTFYGANKKRGAVIRYNLNKLPEDKSSAAGEKKEKKPADGGKNPPSGGGKKKGKDKKEMDVYILSGIDTVRHFRTKADTGLNRFSWNLERDGARMPSWKKPKKDALPPWGPQVEPGEYKVLVSWNEQKDSTTVKVLPDPRLMSKQADWEAREKWIAKHRALVETARTATDQLLDMRKKLGQINKNISESGLADADSLKKLSKPLSDSIKVMLEWFMLPENFKGYDHVTVRINSLIGHAGSFISSEPGELSPNGQFAMQRAQKELEEAVEKINNFHRDVWLPHRQMVESLELPLYQDFKPIQIPISE